MRKFISVLGVALLLLTIWLLLNQSLAPGQIATGALLTLLILALTVRSWPSHISLHRIACGLRLGSHVLVDIVQANFEVAGVILGRQARRSQSSFVQIPLELRAPLGLAMLACIITATPGTVWAGLSADGAQLTIHVLELTDG
ncbi:MAG: Na+/H+ antiporter subunit E, partial [Herbaspirillum sp.]